MVNRKIVIMSDIHFGASFDQTGDDETNTKDLINCLDLIENEIKPEKIILLGDVFDLWRADFENAWDEATDIRFFSRLSKYSRENKAEIVFVVGNHDHYLKEMDSGLKNQDCFDKIMQGTAKKCPQSHVLDETLGIKLKGDCEGITIKYPHHKLEVDGLGMVYFDHGHYAEGAASTVQKWVGIVRNKVFGNYTPVKADFEEIYVDMESNLTAGYSMIYYARMDDMVREVRDKLYRLSDSIVGTVLGNRWVKAIIVVVVIGGITGFAGVSVLKPEFSVLINNTMNIADNPSSNVAELVKLAGMVLGGGVTVQNPYKIIPRIFNYFGNTYKGELRGSNIQGIADKMTKEDMTIERKNYTYLDFLKEGLQKEGDKNPNINHYIFGHTHIAGIYETAGGLRLYNTGSFVKKKNKPSNGCTNSFIIIDPSLEGNNKIKVYHMNNMEMEACEFNKDGTCTGGCKK